MRAGQISQKNVLKFVKSEISEFTKIPAKNINEAEPISHFCLDSIHFTMLQAHLEKKFDVHYGMEHLYYDPSLLEISKQISQDVSSGGSKSFNLSFLQGNTDLQNIIAQIPQVNRRVVKQLKREVLISGKYYSDFASCNYLGLDYHPSVIETVTQVIQEWGVHPSWTRAVASPEPYFSLEKALASLLHVNDVLVFPNVAMVHLGILPLLAGPNGVIISDNCSHHTIDEACELAKSRGTIYEKYRHGDLAELEKLLIQYQDKENIIVAVDGVYSMNVNYLDVAQYAALVKKYNAILYIDDAHGFGVIGEGPNDNNAYGLRGNGIANYAGLSLNDSSIVYVAGLSKAYSSHAAFITCHNKEMRQKFQQASTYIFSGPVPFASLASALQGIKVNELEGDKIRKRLFQLTKSLVDGAREIGFEVDNTNYFPIVFLVIGGINDTIMAARIAWEYGLLITPGIFPAVPLNRGGLRFSVTALNTEIQIENALKAFKAIRNKLFTRKGRTL